MSQTETSRFHKPANNSTPKDLHQPSEASDAQESHLLLVQDDEGRRIVPLDAEVYSLGRSPNCDIRLFSMFVSNQHATLRRIALDDGSYCYKIMDGNLQGQPSTNGILVNGRKISAYELKDSDHVMFSGSSGVSAKYYRLKPEDKRLKSEDKQSGSQDPFDITLIDPSVLDG
ncbi:FHA domain protein [Coleofasciculus chthonoplastes PCC 7420]|uniref:FHA domain protein n=1 Tax=Coleofasciculus chthonoplastes PCC 7420 TaxID=118168 RepID=B4W2A7_9CYAN|nr:FHA domain-containing protein [Coleofasciculus chthonoplastes]EDX71669.1 FHA domain protein [Coleofasciculus chthonoplastes PCC 7420]